MLISVKVKTGTQKSAVIEKENFFEVWVRARPEKGKANEEVIKILSEHFKIPQSFIKIKSGKTSSRKIVEIK